MQGAIVLSTIICVQRVTLRIAGDAGSTRDQPRGTNATSNDPQQRHHARGADRTAHQRAGPLRDAETALCEACPNGRDYYHVPGALAEAVKEHGCRLATIRMLITDLEQEAIAISEL